MSDLPQIEQILERQVRSWELRRKLAGEGGDVAREALAHLAEGPWVSISRQLGAGGQELAEGLGRHMGWQVYDREILRTIADHTHTRETILSRLDRQTLTPFIEFISRLLVSDDPSQMTYLKEMTKVVWGLARQGQAIILGRGANWFLDPRSGLRLRVVAPLELRVGRVAGQEQIGAAEARRRIIEHDAQRKAFIEQFFKRQIDDPLGYDLTINLGSMDCRAAGDLVVAAMHAKLDLPGSVPGA